MTTGPLQNLPSRRPRRILQLLSARFLPGLADPRVVVGMEETAPVP